MVHSQVTQYTRLDLNLLRIRFPFHFVAGFQFFLCHYTGSFEHGNGFRFQVVIEDNRNTGFAIQATAGGFFLPFVAVTIAVKMNRFTFLDISTDNFENGRHFRLSFFNQSIHIFLKLHQLVCYGRVQCNHGRCTVCLGTYGTELKTVSGESKRRGTVTVSIVNQQFGNLRNIQLHSLFAAKTNQIIFRTVFNVIQYLRQLLP